MSALASCNPGGPEDAGPDDPTPPAETSEAPSVVDPAAFLDALPVDASLLSSSAQPTDLSAVGGRDGLPGVVLTRATGPGSEAPHLVAWQIAESGASEIDLGLPMTGELRTVEIAADEVTAVAGSTWEAGAVTSFLARSSDRATWTDVPLPDELGGVALLDVSVSGSRITAVGIDAARQVVLVSVGAEDVVTVADIAPAPSGQNPTVVLATVGDDVVVVSTSEGQRPGIVGWRSTDAGSSFEELSALPDSGMETLSGIAAQPFGGAAYWLVSGTQRNEAGNVRPLVLSSTDGTTWEPETDFIYDTDEEWVPWNGEVADASIGEPMFLDTGVATILGSASGTAANCVYRNSPPQWFTSESWCSLRAFTGGPSASGVAVPKEGGGASVVRLADGVLQVSTITAEGVWVDAPPVTRASPPFLSSIIVSADDADTVEVALQRLTLTVSEERWRRDASFAQVMVDASGATPATPVGAEHVEVGTGTDRLRMDLRAPDGNPALGFSYLDPAGGWVPSQGDFDGLFGGTPVRVSDRWVISATERPGFAYSSGRNEVAHLTSTDGVAFSRVGPDQTGAPTGGGSSIGQTCSAPGGEFVTVGEVMETLPEARGGVWWGSGDEVRYLEADTGASTRFTACATVSETVVAVLETPEGTQTGSLSPEGAFETRASLPAGTTLGRLTGGESLLGIGDVRTRDYVGPAILISADGAAWSWVPLPTLSRNFRGQIAVQGDDAIVAGVSEGGLEAWHVSDLAGLIAAAVPLEDA
ncbi:hypothetical protein C8046_03510 [Serinibacter arcticus]|uniref:Uncharacterized protein n=1 Tax=Serinibacter arcticus TaxID=1655435 RepID=A0A2U1ZSC4_9MICO|nr:hypothetical protein C8046_03510 [Serinibacter arcticus]